MKKIISLLLAVIMVVSLFPVMAFADEVTLGNDGYPYTESMKDEGSKNEIIKLSPVIASGTPASFQWKYSTTKNGTYRNIADDDNVASGASTQELTITAVSGESEYDQKWIKCVVDGVETKPVQIIVPKDNETKGGAKFVRNNGKWYVTDGNMMYNYVPSEKYFDIMGKYAGYDGITYWFPTTFDKAWYISTSDSDKPGAVRYNVGPAYLDSFNVSFDGENGLAFEIVLGEDQKSVGFGDDLYFGNSNAMGGTNPDKVALKAVLDGNGVAEQFQIVGEKNLNDADGDTASFVLRPVTDPSFFGIGHWSGVNLYSYYTSTENNYRTRKIGETENVVYEVVSDIDTGMTVSWVDVQAGGDGKRTVKFTSKIGTVEETGASVSDEPYDVTFMNWDGERYVQYGDKLVDQQNGSRIAKPADPAPANEGDIFGGWYTAENGGKLWDFDSRVYTDKTLYARWHNVEKVEGKPADCSRSTEEDSKNGYKDYYKCKYHGEYYEDAACTKLIENLINWKNGDGKILAQHHLVATDNGGYKCDNEGCNYTIPGAGVKSEGNVSGSIPGIDENTPEEQKEAAIKAIVAAIPAEILKNFSDGADLEIVLNTNSIEGEPNQIEEIKEELGAKEENIKFYNITLNVYETNDEGQRQGDEQNVTELADGGIQIGIPAPEGFILEQKSENFTRHYYVIRFHDDEVEVLNAYLDGNGNIVFKTDKFSTYALMYVDEPIVKKTYGNTIVIGEDRVTEETKEAETNPDTGAPVMNMGAVAIVLGAAYVVFKKH